MKIAYFLPCFASGGAETFIVNSIEAMVERGHECEIISITSGKSIYSNRLDDIGVLQTTLIDRDESGPIARYFWAYAKFYNYLKEHPVIDAIHFNVAQGEELPFVWIAKRMGVVARILHSHSSASKSPLKWAGHRICKLLFSRSATAYVACSDRAAAWMFSKNRVKSGNYIMMSNGIKVNEYRFSADERTAMRRNLGIDDAFCFISVGRLEDEKNHIFMIDAFSEIKKKIGNAKLLLVGDGSLKREIIKRIKEKGLEEQVMLLGLRNDIPALLSAADCFILTSKFEGFPYCLVEAQAAGLPCVVANTISKQCAITPLMVFAPLRIEEFSERACEQFGKPGSNRESFAQRVGEAGFDVDSNANTLLELYVNGDCSC